MAVSRAPLTATGRTTGEARAGDHDRTDRADRADRAAPRASQRADAPGLLGTLREALVAGVADLLEGEPEGGSDVDGGVAYPGGQHVGRPGDVTAPVPDHEQRAHQ